MTSPLRRLRLVGFLEGISFLVLLGIAMPLKYLAGQPTPVLVAGWIHGLLFVLFIAAILQARMSLSWTAGALAASVLPFGPFVFDAWLRQSLAKNGAERTAEQPPS